MTRQANNDCISSQDPCPRKTVEIETVISMASRTTALFTFQFVDICSTSLKNIGSVDHTLPKLKMPFSFNFTFELLRHLFLFHATKHPIRFVLLVEMACDT